MGRANDERDAGGEYEPVGVLRDISDVLKEEEERDTSATLFLQYSKADKCTY